MILSVHYMLTTVKKISSLEITSFNYVLTATVEIK